MWKRHEHMKTADGRKVHHTHHDHRLEEVELNQPCRTADLDSVTITIILDPARPLTKTIEDSLNMVDAAVVAVEVEVTEVVVDSCLMLC
jgi:hypothetical protein